MRYLILLLAVLAVPAHAEDVMVGTAFAVTPQAIAAQGHLNSIERHQLCQILPQ